MTDFFNSSLPIDSDILSTITSEITAAVNVDATTVAAAAAASGGSVPVWIGFIGCLVASLFFGSNLVPVKQFSTGDGVFFQFVCCVTIYIVGLIVDLILNNQRYYPLVLIGGNRSFHSWYRDDRIHFLYS